MPEDSIVNKYLDFYMIGLVPSSLSHSPLAKTKNKSKAPLSMAQTIIFSQDNAL